jgi:hypothetical protein
MSLAVVVDVGRQDASRRVAALVGLLMTAVLLLAASEQSDDGGRGWLALVCALFCAAWSATAWGRPKMCPTLRLQVTAEGRLRLLGPEIGTATDALLLHGWSVGPVIVLRVAAQRKVDPAALAANDGQSASVLGSVDCRLVLVRGSCDVNRWHALRRWLVWYRRSGRHEAVAA